MLKKQIFKSLEGAQRRCAFENAHSSFKWSIVRCLPDGTPDGATFERGKKYVFRLQRSTK
jgi:hypothetical protein